MKPLTKRRIADANFSADSESVKQQNKSITREDVIRMAKESGFKACVGTTDKEGNYHPFVNALGKDIPIEWLERFAALAALDTAQQEPVNAMLMEALERMVESVTGVDQVSAVDEARAALTAAQQAQPEPSDLRGIDAGTAAEWVDLVKRGYVSRDECLIAVKDIPLWIAKNSEQAQPSQADAQDAARYRWLRSTTNWASNSSNERIDVRNSPELWDAAIDAAINAKERAAHGIKQGGQHD